MKINLDNPIKMHKGIDFEDIEFRLQERKNKGCKILIERDIKEKLIPEKSIIFLMQSFMGYKKIKRKSIFA